jgi:DNA-directed RNA polymerase III subunit RPC1
LDDGRFQSLLPTAGPFVAEIRDYYSDIAKKQKELMEIDGVEDQDVDSVTWNSCRIAKTQLDLAMEKALPRYSSAYVELGEAVGATGAQSISEPGTQMTLKVREVTLTVVTVIESGTSTTCCACTFRRFTSLALTR